ncbi:MAG: hemolysin family protein [Actinomycetota bacterium]
MTDILANVGLVLLFVLIGGVFAASEIALVSLRDSQLEEMRRRGGRGLRVAHLASDANRFLSAVQVGVTLAGFFSASYGATALVPDVAPVLQTWGVPAGSSETVALVAITLLISYFSLVLGELVPKRLALQRAEGLALLVAVPLDLLATAMRPVIWLLSRSTDAVVRLLGGDPHAQREEISEEELQALIRTHRALSADERRIVSDVFQAGDRAVHEVMLPRTEVDFLPATMPVAEAVAWCKGKPHSRYPVIGESADDVRGFVHVRDLFDPDLRGTATTVGDVTRQVLMLPEGVHVLQALSRLRQSGTHLAIVVDEYGGTSGIVTLEDLIEEFVGEIHDEYDLVRPESRRLRPGSYDVDGLLHVDDLPDVVPGLHLPEGGYDTVGGFVMDRLGRMPRLGDRVVHDGHQLTVSELDGNRVARVLVTRVQPQNG